MVEGRMGPAKSKDFGTAVGPVVVTADELLPQLDDLHVEVRVNDEIVATGSTRGMRHSVADVVAYASAGEPELCADPRGSAWSRTRATQPPPVRLGDGGDPSYHHWEPGEGDVDSPLDRAVAATRRAVWPLHGLDPVSMW